MLYLQTKHGKLLLVLLLLSELLAFYGPCNTYSSKKKRKGKNTSGPKASSQRTTTKEDIHTYFQHLCADVAPESARRTLLPFLGCMQPRVVKA